MLDDAAAPFVAVAAFPSVESGSGPQIDLGSSYNVRVSATDNVGVANVGLMVDGQMVSLDSAGITTLTASQLGAVELFGTATDVNGNEGTASVTVTICRPVCSQYADSQ